MNIRLDAIFLVFLVLKLAGYIGWSWWWITSPLWIFAIIFCIVLLLKETI